MEFLNTRKGQEGTLMKKIEIILEIQIKDADENMQPPTMFHQIRWREKASFLFFYNGRPH